MNSSMLPRSATIRVAGADGRGVPVGSHGWSALPRRLLGAVLLRPSVYEDVEADATATAQAALVVMASSIAGGIGATGFTAHGAAAAVFFTVVGLLFWVAWALVTLEI